MAQVPMQLSGDAEWGRQPSVRLATMLMSVEMGKLRRALITNETRLVQLMQFLLVERELAADSDEPDTAMFEKMLFRTQRRIDEAQERIAHFEQEGNNKKPQLQSDL